MSNSDKKRYYWLRLKEDFFGSDSISWLEEQDNGVYCSNLYLKLLLMSLRKDGVVVRMVGEKAIPYNAEALARVTNIPIDKIDGALSLLEDVGLVENREDGALFLPYLDDMVGSESTSAARVRKWREKKEDKPNEETSALHCNSNVTKCNKRVTNLKPRDRDRERDIDIDIDIDNNILPPAGGFAHEIIDYLNKKAGTHYKSTTSKTQKLIQARSKDGFTKEDFFAVIDKKCAEWLYNPDMVKYIRPETLFGSKFEGYLNQRKLEKATGEDEPSESLKELYAKNRPKPWEKSRPQPKESESTRKLIADLKRYEKNQVYPWEMQKDDTNKQENQQEGQNVKSPL